MVYVEEFPSIQAWGRLFAGISEFSLQLVTNIFAMKSLTIFCFFQYKLCKVRKTQLGHKGIPFLVTHDGRTIRYPDPLIKAHDTVQLDLASGKITDHIKFDSGKEILLGLIKD